MGMEVIGVDPGSKKSAFVLWDNKEILDKGIHPNEDLLEFLVYGWCGGPPENIILAVESMVKIPGGAGKSIIQTIEWADRFYQAWQGEKAKVPVGNVRLALCRTMRSDNADVRRALIERFGEPGTKKNPNPIMYGLKGSGYHLVRAFAVAVVHFDHLAFQGRELK